MNHPQKKGRRPASGTAAAAFDALQQAAAGWPPMPANLRESERTYWDAVMVGRLPQQWAEIDLLHAANLARCLADIEVHRKAMLREGMLIGSPSGPRVNPRHIVLETLNRRAISLTRVLQLQAVMTVGPMGEHPGTKAEAAAAAGVLKQASVTPIADALLARPHVR